MKLIITENQFKRLINNIINEEDNSLKLREKYHIMEDWFVPLLNQLTEKTSDNYPGSIFWVNENNKVYMEHDQKNKWLWVDYDEIWSYFYKNYSHNYKEISKLIQGLVGEHLNLWGITPLNGTVAQTKWVGEHLNLWGITPKVVLSS